ncbi:MULTISPECIES: winged helix DNA-binding protein [unclassified Devosia]|uniref:winged helix DNA-binding protein n=1 Tax=unclassified Devosia TaxID=196773 RepID=UPI001AD34AC9|nr:MULTISPECIES: winged helix DNA-binding protein [unclassified Devosia]MBN9307426.1 winged helix DNA-binding protein [Devosia sp.]
MTDSDFHPTPDSASLSDLEFSMIVAVNGFWQWVVHCAEAAGARGLSALDILVLHAVNQRARNKRLSDICLVLNVEDSHTVAYALKKLEEQGYVAHRQDGRDRIYAASPDGDALCGRYLEVRDATLIDSLRLDGTDFAQLDETARSLARMTRYYAHASRIAAIAKQR